MSNVMSGKNILIKLLQPRGPATMIGITSVRFYGYKGKHSKSNFVEHCMSKININLNETEMEDEKDKITTNENTAVSSEVVLLHTLMFISGLAARQLDSKPSAVGKHGSLDLSEFDVDAFWSIYDSLRKCENQPVWLLCKFLCLKLFLALLPHISENTVQDSCRISLFFQHLCDVVDSKTQCYLDESSSLTANYQDNMKIVAQEIIASGVTVFFPDEDARRKKLLSMIDTITVCEDEFYECTLNLESDLLVKSKKMISGFLRMNYK